MSTLSEDIETLIEAEAADFEISKRFKKSIAEYNESLPQLFEQNQGKDFLVRHTKTVDDFLILMYKTVLRRMFGNYLPMRSAIPVALIALGSYGREQLAMHSDVDLMIVFEPIEGYSCEAIVERFLYLAWDAGLKLGHRVHKIRDLFDAAEEDITIRTAMMEARFIVGSTFAWHSAQRQLGRIRRHEPARFLKAKIEEAYERHRKYPISMQPNIKESVGGLRDSHLIFWVANTLYDVDSVKSLAGRLFSDEAYRRYRQALELLFRVRSALHLSAGKQHDQLNLEYLPRVRKLLGYDDDMKLATQVVEAMWRVNNFSHIFVNKMTRPLFADHQRTGYLKSNRVAPHFYTVDGRLCTTYKLPAQPLVTLLELLDALEDRPWVFDGSIISQFTFTAITRPFKKRVYQLLLRLFQRRHTFCFLKLFYDAKVLDMLIPAFKKTLFLPQFDGYHQYPVGLHSLMCVKALESIDDPFIAALHESFDAKDKALLKIVVLLHDSGKGRKLNHSEVGVKLIGPLVDKLGFNADDRQTASLLVRHHILMSSVAQRHDIHNEKTLYKFMSMVQTQRNLKLLYVLTYADMSGVGPGIYNAFNAKLLRELYDAALEVSQETERITDAARRLKAEQRIRKLATFKNLPKLMQKNIISIESNPFFFRHSPAEIIDISCRARDIENYSYILTFHEGLHIEILRKIPLNLTYLLGRLGYLNVVSMEVFTLFEGVKYFKIDFLQTPTPDMYETIREIVELSFSFEKSVPMITPKIKEDQISVDCEHSKTYAEFSVNTANQKGLLAFIVQGLDTMGLTIATAKIQSTKHRARDHFLIEKTPQLCDNPGVLIQLLCQGDESCAV